MKTQEQLKQERRIIATIVNRCLKNINKEELKFNDSNIYHWSWYNSK